VALLLFVLGLVAAPLPAQASAGAMLRLAQLSPELKGVELEVSSVADSRDSVMVGALGYGELSPYRSLQPGDYVIALRNAGETAPPAVSRTLAVRSGAAYTVAAVGPKAEDGLVVFDDDLTPPPDPTSTRMRIINAAPPAPALDVRTVDGQPLSLGLTCGRAGEYRTVAAGDLALAVGPPGGPSAALPPVTLAANQVASVLLTGGDGGVRASVVVDAAGPGVVPPGPVHAGFGGTAGDAAGRGVGSGVLIVLAAGAALVSVRLARRSG
jgi:hypothetical protein